MDVNVLLSTGEKEREFNMNTPCHRCKKTVYPVEKLNCLDKTWHKGCFNCETCHMTLSMKTYKGYSKLPYCNTHYPTTKFTAVADTPENNRVARNTAQQSSVVYHKDFEQEKGKFTKVADDPETLRIKKTQQQASDLAYEASKQARERTAQPSTVARVTRAPAQAPPPAPAPPPTQSSQGSGQRYIALYDYTAADDDEVSFQENDVIVEANVIDDGWMEGRVERTGQYGMLPSNYVEKQ